MLQALLVTFREGLESFLIVAMIAGYLRKTGKRSLLSGVVVGVVASIVTCVVGARLWQQVLDDPKASPNQPLYEAMFAFAAAAIVGVLLVQMVRVGRHFKGDIEARIERASGGGAAGAAAELVGGPSSLRAIAGVALVTTLLISREGLEAVLFLGVQLHSSQPGAVGLGAGIGLVLAAAIATVWVFASGKIHLGVLLKVTAIFLAIFLLQLVIVGVHELAESGVIEGSQAFHNATEILGPDGSIGHAMTYSLLGAPILYLILARQKRGARTAS